MPETLKEFATIKGRQIIIYQGNKRSEPRNVRFKLNGANRDISAGGENWGDLKFIVKKPNTKDADAYIAETAVVKTTETEGLVTLPLDTVNATKRGEGLVLVIWEIHDTDKKRIRAKFKCDIVDSDLD